MEKNQFSELEKKTIRKALSHKKRRALIGLIYDEEPISEKELVTHIGTPQEELSYHLDILEGTGLIRQSQEDYLMTETGNEYLEKLRVADKIIEGS